MALSSICGPAWCLTQQPRRGDSKNFMYWVQKGGGVTQIGKTLGPICGALIGVILCPVDLPKAIELVDLLKP